MGIKGDKLTSQSAQSSQLIVEKLEPIAGITTRKMFGGHGIFHEDKTFGIIGSPGDVYLKVDPSNQSRHENAGSTSHGKLTKTTWK